MLVQVKFHLGEHDPLLIEVEETMAAVFLQLREVCCFEIAFPDQHLCAV